jgi:hypothetical protein
VNAPRQTADPRRRRPASEGASGNGKHRAKPERPLGEQAIGAALYRRIRRAVEALGRKPRPD